MRLTLAIVMLCLLLGQVGCARKSANQANTSNSSVSDKNLAGAVDPTQARVYLEQGKELYKKDEDSAGRGSIPKSD